MSRAQTERAIKYCAEECTRQSSGEMSVYNMFKAYNATIDLDKWAPSLQVRDILVIGMLVEPTQNAFGFRHVNVIVSGNLITHKHIEDNIVALCEASNEERVDATEFYHQFELIHPFIDGNGRVGSLLWNMLRGTINSPKAPPNIFANCG